MAEFEAPLPDYRLVKTHYGDSLQDVAMRELGDENRWIELVWLNDLVWPYLTDDPAQATAKTLVTGTLIKVPAPNGKMGQSQSAEEAGQIYERDIKMVNRRLVLDSTGDIAVVAGVKNLTQQLKHRINTPTGQARRHPQYGCRIHELRGKVNGPLAVHLAREYMKTTVKAEYRIARIRSLVSSSEGDVIRVDCVGEAINGDKIDLTIDT